MNDADRFDEIDQVAPWLLDVEFGRTAVAVEELRAAVERSMDGPRMTSMVEALERRQDALEGLDGEARRLEEDRLRADWFILRRQQQVVELAEVQLDAMVKSLYAWSETWIGSFPT